MKANESLHRTSGVPEDPESFSVALAHVITSESGQETVLGQAWLAAPNRLVTCGHVVENHVANPTRLAVKFPSSGNRYLVKEIFMHPNFKRQSDQLVRFDAAALTVELGQPELGAQPLPVTYQKPVKTYQPLSAIRYPVHLGQFTSAPRPLAQLGRMLGLLRQDDSFHLLHDLALAPGDSGAPIFDERTVVALHCGDTASLPGLNLPTTSIRLGLWVDALKQLNIQENTFPKENKTVHGPLKTAAAFVVGCLLSFSLAIALLIAPGSKAWAPAAPVLKPLHVSFNKPLDGYREDEKFSFNFQPRTDCFAYLFYLDGDKAMVLYPFPGQNALVKAGQLNSVGQLGPNLWLLVTREPSKFHWVLLKNDENLFHDSERVEGQEWMLKMTPDQLKKRIEQITAKDQAKVLHLIMDGPIASPLNGS